MQSSRDKMQKIFVLLFVLCVCAGVVMCVSVRANFSTDLNKIGDEPVEELTTGWTEISASGQHALTLPGVVTSKDDRAVITRRITAHAGDQLMVPTLQQTLTVYIDGEEIYSGGRVSHTVFGYAMGHASQLINITRDLNDAELTLEFANQLSKSSFHQQIITLSSPLGNVMWTLRNNVLIVIFCIIIFVIGIILIAVDLLMHIYGGIKRDIGLSCVGLFALVSSFWVLSDTMMLQFVSSNRSFLYTVSYLSFMLMPMPLLLYLHAMLENGRKLLSTLCAVTMLNYFLTMILFFVGVPLPYLLFTTHIVIIALVVCVIYICIKTDETTYDTTPAREVMYGMMILCVAGLLALVSYYVNPSGRYILLFCAGLTGFIIMLAIGSARRAVSLIHTNVENAAYNRIAYVDTLTELGNRAALERENRRNPESESTAVFSMDISGLRAINREHGYEAGNDVLRAFGRCMSKAGADCNYRIGSDEFAAVLYNMRAMDVTRYVARLEECVNDYNNRAIVPIEYTIGNAAGAKGASLLKLLDDAEIMRRAKKTMYAGIK